MKYIKEYDIFINEAFKHDAFILLNNMGPNIKKVRDLIFGKKLGETKLGLLNPLTKIATGLGITISLIYLIMWYHNKQLDKVQPEIEEKLKKYQKLLDSEFTPKEQDDFIRIIASDKGVLDSVTAVLNGNKDPEHLKYIESRFNKKQIEKIYKLASKIDSHEKTNESLNEAEWFELLGLTKNDVSHIKNVSDIGKDPKIKSAFRKKSMEVHPDRNPNDPNAGKKMSAVIDAYEKGKGSDIDGKMPKNNIGNDDNYTGGFGNNWSDEDKAEYRAAAGKSYGENMKRKKDLSDIFDTSGKNGNIDNDIKKYTNIQSFMLALKQGIIIGLLQSSISQILSSNKRENIEKIKKVDKDYSNNIEILQFIFDEIFDAKTKKELNNYFEKDLEYINYTQRINRLSNLNDRKRLSDAMSEHLAEKMPPKLYKKYQGFIKVGEDNNLFTKGSLTPHSLSKTYGTQYTMDMLKTHILPQLKFYRS